MDGLSDRSDIPVAQNAPPHGGAFFCSAPLLCLLLLCGAIYLFYAPGLGFGLVFDDIANLAGLSRVHDATSALLFIFNGEAGPLGRPVSLATFALQAGDWPDRVDVIVRWNILLHLVNAVLVAVLARRLVFLLPGVTWRPDVFAVTVAALWASSPLLMSTSLMPVQRMTSLSAFFCLLGTMGWLRARSLLTERPWHAITGMTLAVLAGTAAAALSKETGALLPLFILTTEVLLARATLVPRFDSLRHTLAWRVWCALVFGLPVLGILHLGWRHLVDVDAAYAGFGYGPWARLLTEAGVLFAYLRQLLFPLRSGLGPFHDDVLVVATGTGLFLLLCWAGLVLLAWALRRGRFRAFSFACGWFLAGHILESTIFPLEPYFEHRSYLPAVGVWIGVCALLWSGIATLRHAGRALLGLLLLNNLFVLRESGLVWSDPVVAGRIWHEEHPDSIRALLQYGRALGERGEIGKAVSVYDAATPRLQASPHYQAGRLQLYCATRPPERVAEATGTLEQVLAVGRIDYHVPESVGLVMQLAATQRCKGFDTGRGRAILESIALSTSANVMPRARRAAHAALADYWFGQRELDPTLRHLDNLWSMSGDIADMRKTLAVLVSARLCEVAHERLETLSHLAPASPLRRIAWNRQFAAVTQDVTRGCGAPGSGGRG